MSEQSVQDHSAAYYPIRYSGYGLKYHTYLIRWLMQYADGKILDAGCGTGMVSHLYPTKNILGIDLSDGMLALHRGQNRKMDVTAMTFGDETFDFVLCRSLLHHLPNHLAGLSEMRRVLKPKGRIAFLETNQSALATWIRSKTQHGDRFSDYHHSFKETELLRDLQQWFDIEAIRYFGYVAYPLYGFPDIIDFSRYLLFNRFLYPLTLGIDECCSRLPGIQRMSFAIGIHAHKA